LDQFDSFAGCGTFVFRKASKRELGAGFRVMVQRA